MTDEELLEEVKLLYGSDLPYSDDEVSAFIRMAKREAVRHVYQLIEEPDEDAYRSEWDSVVEMAVIVGLTQHGAEGEAGHTEGSFRRDFNKPTMLGHIRANLIPYAGFGR